MTSARQVEAEAAAWLARRDGPAWQPSDEAELSQWIAASTAHRVAYLRLQSVWDKADRLRALGPESLVGDVPGGESTAPAEAGAALRRRPMRLCAAAAAALVAATSLWFGLRAGEQYATPVGGFERIPLADGSHVELNTDTELELAYSDSVRRIELDKGEAFFKVAKDQSRPFVVVAGRFRVVAVGTAFSVRVDSDEVAVVVSEGKVRVEQPGARSAPVAPVLVAAGQVADAQPASTVVTPVSAAEVERQLGWRDGLLIFERRPLRDVAAEFNRYNQRQLVVADPAIADVMVGGTFRATNLDGFLRLLELGFDIKAVPDGSKRIVLEHAA